MVRGLDRAYGPRVPRSRIGLAMTDGATRSAQYRARKRAAGYVFVKGRPVWRPVRIWAPGLRPHGTESRYCQGCHCEECRAAHAKYKRDRRARGLV